MSERWADTNKAWPDVAHAVYNEWANAMESMVAWGQLDPREKLAWEAAARQMAMSLDGNNFSLCQGQVARWAEAARRDGERDEDARLGPQPKG